MLENIFKLLLKFPKRTLLLIGLTTLLFSIFIPTLKLDFTVEDLFSEYDASAKEYARFKNDFGREDNFITLIYKTQNPFSKSLYIELEELIFQIEDLSEIENIVSLFTISDIDSNAWIGDIYDEGWNEKKVQSALKFIQKDPVLGNRVLSENLQYGSIILTLKKTSNNHSDRTKVIEKIKDLTMNSSPEWVFSGITVLRTEFVKLMLKDNLIFVPLISLILIIALWFIFRNWVHVFLPLLTVSISVIWLLGLMGLLGLSVNIMNYIVPSILFIIAIGDAIHIQARFKENLSKNKTDPHQAMIKTMVEMSKVIFLTSLTTSIGFLALASASIPILQEFGMEIAIGVMIAWLVSISIVPCGIILFKGFNYQSTQPFNKFLHWLSDTIILKPWLFIIIPSIISAFFISKIMDLSTDASLLDDLRPNNQLYKDLKFTEKYFGGVLPLEVLLKINSDTLVNFDNFKSLEVFSYLEKIESVLKAEIPNGRFLSFLDILNSAKRLQLGKNISDQELIDLILKDQLKNKNKIISDDQKTLRISGIIENKTSLEMENIYNKLDALSKELPKYLSISYTGTTVVALKTNKYLVKALSNSLSIALILISIILAFMFRSKSILFASLLTNLIPIFTMIGILAWFDIPLRVPTAFTFSVALGIAVDDSLHFLLRFKRELSKGLSRKKAIKNTIMNTGAALMITTTVLVSGFLCLLLSAFLPSFQFGLLSAAMIGTALICDLTLLPALCLVLPKNKS